MPQVLVRDGNVLIAPSASVHGHTHIPPPSELCLCPRTCTVRSGCHESGQVCVVMAREVIPATLREGYRQQAQRKSPKQRRIKLCFSPSDPVAVPAAPGKAGWHIANVQRGRAGAGNLTKGRIWPASVTSDPWQWPFCLSLSRFLKVPCLH